ncbi:hypothetical protein [Spirochaeta lutea]|uniref:Uncharacterized protein n=1 Tax=Spirochaeta lutea TaxID=1480694 RepID=A0A098R1U6_9SPIO|nr:hypothetical protein [Spirochaeta lutea]KGE73643.1 hypothetical protein DC28_03145 [Spirochaeta lutea]
MKFKSIFIIFNTIIVLSFLLIFFMPLFVLGVEYARSFWAQSWYLLILFLGVLSALDFYFIKNWKVFQYLESEDWKNLSDHLENRIIRQGKVSHQGITLLINSYLMQNRLDDVQVLAKHITEHHPRYLNKNAVSLGLPVLLRNKTDEIIHYYGQFISDSGDVSDPWILWNYSFGLLMKGERDQAKAHLRRAYQQAGRDAVLKLLSVYMLDSFRQDDPEVNTLVGDFLDWLTGRYSLEQWIEKTKKTRDNLQLFIIQRIVTEASRWAFEDQTGRIDEGASRE